MVVTECDCLMVEFEIFGKAKTFKQCNTLKFFRGTFEDLVDLMYFKLTKWTLGQFNCYTGCHGVFEIY